MSWVEAASPELEQNKTAQAFIGLAGQRQTSVESVGKRRKSYHPASAPLRTALINHATNEIKNVIFTGVPPISAVHESIRSSFKWADAIAIDFE